MSGQKVLKLPLRAFHLLKQKFTRTTRMNKPKLNILKAITLILIIAVALTVFMSRGEARISRKQENSEALAKKVLMAEQAGKNIKILKGMPNAQLIPAMRFMSASLGVRCEYCHVGKDGQLDAAAEDKKEKQTARDMIRMVREINGRNFKGEAQVSCYTCHMGQPIPQRFPALPVPMASPAPAKTANALPPLPSGAAIVDNYIAAIGGQAAVDRVTSSVIEGKFATASGVSGTYQAEQVPPDKGYESIMTSRGGRERAASRESGWEKTSFGVTDLSPDQVPDMQLSLPLLLDIQLRKQYSEIDVSGKEKIDNRDAYVVDATRRDDKRERLYFDTENGLLVRRISYTPTMIGIIPEQTDFGGYREIDGIKLPFSVRISIADSNNPSTMRTFEEVKLNVPVSESKFNKPTSP
jgi:hypothetical protein